MNRYHGSVSMWRRIQVRYFGGYVVRCDGGGPGAACQGRNVGRVTAVPCWDQPTGGSRLYSAGVDRISDNYYDNVHTAGVDEVSGKFNDYKQVGVGVGYGGGIVEQGKPAGQFSRQSNPTSHEGGNNWERPRNVGQYSMENNVGVNPHIPSYSRTGGNPTSSHQMNDGHKVWSGGPSQQRPSNLYDNNGMTHNPGGYQQKGMGVQPNARFPSHSPPIPTAYGSTVDYDEDNVAGTLEELDDCCKELDLEKAVKCLRKLGKTGVYIDLPRYLILIGLCGDAEALIEAKAVHHELIKYMSPVAVSTFNKVLEMYGKCGLMEDAYETFNKMPERNLTTWDTMITWFAKNGEGEDAIDMFTEFKEKGFKPDGEMFLGVFDACGVLGDVTEGLLHFQEMSEKYDIAPTMAHYARIVHMFGSAGYLDGALEFIENMPVEPSVDVWETLMHISRIQGNTELGDRCCQIVEQLDPSRLSQECKDGLLPLIDSGLLKKKVKKANPVEHRKHNYRAGDRSHPETVKIYALLRGLRESMKEAGYVPETRFVLHDIDQESKEEAIMAHSERLACATALMTNPVRIPIRIIKNLRVCGDCHSAFKIISKIVGREVVMRDAKRFHHFRDGKCSCNDYW